MLIIQEIVSPEVLYEEILEVDCRVIPALRGRCQLGGTSSKWKTVKGTTGEELYIVQELNTEKLKKDLQMVKDQGFNSLAVVLAHSYMYVCIIIISKVMK